MKLLVACLSFILLFVGNIAVVLARDTPMHSTDSSIPEVTPISSSAGSSTPMDTTVTESATFTSSAAVVATSGTKPLLTLQSTTSVSETTKTESAAATSTNAGATGASEDVKVRKAMGFAAAVVAAIFIAL